jgi:N6-adenosine-specific RNA methylase IME4
VTPFADLNPPYRTLLADPPWEYPDGFVSFTSRGNKRWIPTDRDLPYSALSLFDIVTLPVYALADKDARLFLWTTNRYLPPAFAVLAAWGFRYQQTLTWHKTDSLPGSVAPNSEFLLVGTRGNPPRLTRARSSVISHAHSRTHSEKPPQFADLVEQVSPPPYLELFARAARLGWDAWGAGFETGTPPPPAEDIQEVEA